MLYLERKKIKQNKIKNRTSNWKQTGLKQRDIYTHSTSFSSSLLCLLQVNDPFPSFPWETGVPCQLGFKNQQGLLERMMTSLIARSSCRALGYPEAGFINPRFALCLAQSWGQLPCHRVEAVKCRASI